jgi:hypothetical protein
MKIGFEYIFVIIAFIVVIVLSSYGSSIVPYQKDDLFSKQFVYEGLENSNTDTIENTDDKKKEDSTNTSDVITGVTNKMDIVKQMAVRGNVLSTTDPFTNSLKGNTIAPPKKESFSGMNNLSPYNFTIPEETLDRLSSLKGGANCDSARSVGYSNSKGPLCMDDATLQLLRTRGGNQTGSPSQIGQ